MRELVIELEVDYYKPVKDERFEGYKLIWYKVILRAIYDYVLYKDSKNTSLRRLADGASRWLYEPDVKQYQLYLTIEALKEKRLLSIRLPTFVMYWDWIQKVLDKLPRDSLEKIFVR